MLQFSDANNKLKKLYNVSIHGLWKWLAGNRRVYSLDLLSGWSCPFAYECLSKVHETGEITKAGNPRVKLQDGENTLFRCFSASQEALLPAVYRRRKHNFDTLRGLNMHDMIHLLNTDLPEDTGILRFHVGGDFFNSDYFFAALNVAMMNPDKLFYAYTKSLPYWIQHKDWADKIDNFVLTASRGGRHDHLIEQHNLRESVVVFSEAEAEEKGLDIDHDDSHAAVPSWSNNDFALLIHGVQPAGTPAARALSALKGKGSYGKKSNAK
jgi:hypothetical protein